MLRQSRLAFSGLLALSRRARLLPRENIQPFLNFQTRGSLLPHQLILQCLPPAPRLPPASDFGRAGRRAGLILSSRGLGFAGLFVRVLALLFHQAEEPPRWRILRFLCIPLSRRKAPRPRLSQTGCPYQLRQPREKRKP